MKQLLQKQKRYRKVRRVSVVGVRTDLVNQDGLRRLLRQMVRERLVSGSGGTASSGSGSSVGITELDAMSDEGFVDGGGADVVDGGDSREGLTRGVSVGRIGDGVGREALSANGGSTFSKEFEDRAFGESVVEDELVG